VKQDEFELSIVIPCLNEEEALTQVLQKSFKSLSDCNVLGEVIVADNGSLDSSREIALQLGARVVDVPIKGYGVALMGGFKSARGKYIVMGDADDSYSLDDLSGFIEKLRAGFDLVMRNRFLGGIEEGAMPFLHKYLGNPVLSAIGRRLFRVRVGDFHCGLSAFKREKMLGLGLRSEGMEFASEMVVKAALNNLRIVEIPTRLSKDGRSRGPHLRTWHDGWRHLIFLLAASPRWLFLYPSVFLLAIGAVGVFLTFSGDVSIAGIAISLNAFFVSIACLISGIQILLLSILARVFSTKHGFLPESRNLNLFEKFFKLEIGILFGVLLLVFSFCGFFYLLTDWTGTYFESLSPASSLRVTGIVILALSVGIQLVFASFFAALIQV